MSEIKHTPTPWISELNEKSGLIHFYGKRPDGDNRASDGRGHLFSINVARTECADAIMFPMRSEVSEGDAALVLEAVNSHATLQSYAHEATKTITGLAGGGSEMFDGQIGDMFKADLPRCAERVRERHETVHGLLIAERKKSQSLQSEIEALKAEKERLREALKPFSTFADDNVEFVPFDPLKMEKSFCWNSNAVKNDRIFEWFGPSDFGKASAALQTGGSNG